ncbi:Hypothetical protein R9X50_00599000 [Acrodontium crateriforme]|uniref:Uncharacterized protein n=1 Tax=Acrodontium crateriforme TaxID=150365 RepID=A0AAQ3M888_9PEZI|nr:Hypothetical protein R9X50_00599000 [Acrodontium crateriforme]
MDFGKKENGVEGAAKSVTSTVGSGAAGLSNTVGGVVGSAGRGLGTTINDTTGTKAVGDGLQGVTDGVEDASSSAARGAKNAGEWKA